ncbi:N-acetylneuraminate synthase [Paenibacillus thiaminolyticus]|nr:N-acetylneuraminate synthase [Paenibacillus thiaminolyticus]
MSVTKHIEIIAEAGVNHNGSLEMAKELVRVAAQSGADAIKFQTFKAQHLVTAYADMAEYQMKTSKAQSQFELLKNLELSNEYHFEIIEFCEKEGIEFLSTPFDVESLLFLVNKCRIKRIKLSSGDLTNGPLLLEAGRSGLPVILSTGMGTLGEIEDALAVLAYGYLNNQEPASLHEIKKSYRTDEAQNILKEKVTLLHCTTEYPTPFHEVNLNVLSTLRDAFGLSVGLSDHSKGISVAIASAALGVSVIEKHFTLNKDLPGPDHQASLEPKELFALVESVRQVEAALGTKRKYPTPSESKNINIARKSLVASQPVRAGEVWTKENVTGKRPGQGISPMNYWDILGKLANKDYEVDEIISRYEE